MQKLPKDYGIMYMYREYVLPIACSPIASPNTKFSFFCTAILCSQ